MSEIHRRRPRSTNFEFSFIGNDRRPSQKSGTRRENRNAPDFPDLSPSIPDDRGYLRFRVFISRQNLGQSGNSKIPDRLGFSRHMKTRLKKDRSDSASRVAFVMCYCFRAPIKTFFFDTCQMTVKSCVLHLFPVPQRGRSHIINILLASFFRSVL